MIEQIELREIRRVQYIEITNEILKMLNVFDVGSFNSLR
jgi:hypothetical protein